MATLVFFFYKNDTYIFQKYVFYVKPGNIKAYSFFCVYFSNVIKNANKY